MTESPDLSKQTRQVFHKIHVEHLADDYIAERHSEVIDLNAMNLESSAISGKLCADLGCGSAGHGVLNLLRLGAEKVHGLDVDDSFIRTASERLKACGFGQERFSFETGSIDALPYPNDTFEFVLCRGVIHHLDNDQQAVNEIYRVLKPGGIAYIFVTGKGGILNRFFKEILREEYKENSELQSLVAKGELKSWLIAQIADLKDRLTPDQSRSYDASQKLLDSVSELIDDDLVLSLRDMVEAPSYNSYTEGEFSEILTRAGFENFHRFGRSPQYRNVRRIFSPLYADHKLPLARLFYHDGSINVLAFM